MIVKLCPLCDSEMKKAHYCDVCHSFVWKPQVMDIHYNTETRGKGEIDCSYGDAHDHYDHQMPQPKDWHKQFEKKKISPDRRRDTPKDADTTKKKPGIGKLIALIVVIITIVDMMASCFIGLSGSIKEKLPINELENLVDLHDEADDEGQAGNGEEGVYESQIEEQMDQGEVSGTEGDLSYEMIEDLSPYREGCAEYDHFDGIIEDFRPAFEDWLKTYSEDRGIDADSISIEEYSYNYNYDLDGTTHTILNSYIAAAFEDASDAWWEIGYDSGSRKIHHATIWNTNEEDARAFVGFALPLLTENEDIQADDALDSLFESGEDMWVDMDNVVLYLTVLDKEDEDGNSLYAVDVIPYN